MAVDDITTILAINMAQNDTTDRQPSAGTEELFLASGSRATGGSAPDLGPQIDLGLIDGTNNDAFYWENSTSGYAVTVMLGAKCAADNTNYFRVTNKSSGNSDYGFAVIQVG